MIFLWLPAALKNERFTITSCPTSPPQGCGAPNETIVEHALGTNGAALIHMQLSRLIKLQNDLAYITHRTPKARWTVIQTWKMSKDVITVNKALLICRVINRLKNYYCIPQVYNRNEVFWGRVAFEHSNLQGIYLKVKLLRLSDASVITECEQGSEHC